MTVRLPKETRTLVLKKSPADRKPLYHDAVIEKRPMPTLQRGQILVKMGAVAFNHRDVGILLALSDCPDVEPITFFSFGFVLGNIRVLRSGPRLGPTVQVRRWYPIRPLSERGYSTYEGSRDSRRVCRSSRLPPTTTRVPHADAGLGEQPRRARTRVGDTQRPSLRPISTCVPGPRLASSVVGNTHPWARLQTMSSSSGIKSFVPRTTSTTSTWPRGPSAV